MLLRHTGINPEFMTHEPRLMRELRNLLATNRVAALGTTQDDGTPFVSMVPFAVERQLCCLVIHVSGLAAHTRYLQARSQVSLLVMVAETPGNSVHDLPRVTLKGHASVPVRGSAEWDACKVAYVERYPDVEHMTELGDFRFVAINVDSARHVSGFGAARTVDAEELKLVLGGTP
jgi:putative heme iron utilization protein